jgi:uncharacterized protein YndB with AHSA1/START domain
MPETRTVSVTRAFDHAPERVFDAWLDPAFAPRFLFATANGTITRCEIDPRVGGRYVIVRVDDEMGEVSHEGEYVEIDRPRRLVFTFGVPKFDPAISRVTIEITPEGRGCTLTLTNADVLEEWADSTQEGWGMILGTLARELAA